MPHEVDEGDCNAAVHIEDQVGLLPCSDLFHLKGVVQQWSLREVALDKLLDQSYPHVWIIDLKQISIRYELPRISRPHERVFYRSHRFDPVADAHNELALLPHAVDELHWNHVCVVGLGELLCSTIQGSTETVALQ